MVVFLFVCQFEGVHVAWPGVLPGDSWVTREVGKGRRQQQTSFNLFSLMKKSQEGRTVFFFHGGKIYNSAISNKREV